MLNRSHTSCTKYILAKVLIVLSKKNQIRISCKYAPVQRMSLSPTKFHEILLSGFRGVRNWETVSVQYFSKFKRCVTPGKKIESEFSSYSAHLHIMFFLNRKFYELLLGGFRGVAQEKYRTDEQTDWRRGKKYYTLRCVGYKNYFT